MTLCMDELYVPHPVSLLFFNVPLLTATTTIETITTTMRDTTTTEAATAPRLRAEELPAWGIHLDLPASVSSRKGL